MSRLETGSRTFFEELRERIREATRRGQFEDALSLCEEAADWAVQHGHRQDRDLVLCNRSAILIARGAADGVGSDLRRVLMGSADPVVRFLASYNLARFHQLRREVERGLFYARLALDHARRAERPGYLTNAHHQVGSLLLVDCRFEEACGSYEEALRLGQTEIDTEHALMISNLGYCEVMLGRHRQGFRRLFESLRLMRRLESGTWAMMPHLGLSYAYLDIRKLEPARRHAANALALAEEAGNRDQTMNALYLLGEAEKLCGRELAAFENFSRLQREFHPNQPYIAEFLMTTDIRPLLHLMA